jgi:hypothetical protein
LAVCFAVVGALGVSAAVAQPTSMAAAEAEGDPAAHAPVVVTPPVFSYGGSAISEAQVERNKLYCEQTATSFNCSAASKHEPGAASAESKRGGVIPFACTGGAVVLQTFDGIQYEGLATGLEPTGAWYDEPAIMNNKTTSFRMGTHAGHMSDFSAGGGFWYPGDTSVCAFRSNINQFDPAWNDRITSRYRVP